MESIQTYRGYPNMWGHQPYRGVSKHRGQPNIGGMQTYWGCLTYRWASKCTGGVQTLGIQMYRDHPNILGHSNIQGVHQSIWGIQMFGGRWTPPWSDEACFICVYVQGASKCMVAYGHALVWQSMLYLCLCMGGIQTYVGVQEYRVQPNIQGAIPTYKGASKHMGHTIFFL